MTNVKTGDMAMVIKATPSFKWTVGRPVKIGGACCFAHADLPAWKFERPLVNNGVAVQCAPDAFLKRIEPLADDDAKREKLEHHLDHLRTLTFKPKEHA